MFLNKPAHRGLHIFFSVFVLMLFFSTSQSVYAQKVNTDSLKQERQRVIDSSRAARQHILDSTKLARAHYNDSVKAARKIISDSLASIRDYKNSKHYKDSVINTRQHRLDSIRAERTAFNDSVKAERKHVLDSTNAVRQAALDSTRAIQKKRADSLAIIRSYRESKRYKDSVAITRQQRLDSIRISRQQYNDSLRLIRKNALDSAVAVRKKINDSLTLIRTQRADSIAKVRKERADSLAKAKEDRERMKKVEEKKKEEKMQLALELKIKKKHQAWNNEKMLKKKWSMPRRLIQNTFTHYNYYFNTDKKMDEALDNMLRMSKENYDSVIALFPFDPDKDSSKLAPDMDSIIQKASLGIQIHDPRTKWADDLYLLMGQAYYYKGDYENAATAFRYIISINQQRKAAAQKQAARKGNRKALKEPIPIVEKDKKSAMDFMKHRSVNNEAILWLARTYTEAHKEGEAESILDLLESDGNMAKDNNGRFALEKAYLNLGRGNYREASSQLQIVSADEGMPRWLRMRASYLNGQLMNQQGNYAGASQQFQQTIDLKPEIEMDFYARKHLAYNKMQEGGDQEQAIAGLKKMLSDGKYATYHEQVYYILGRLAANGNKFDDAITYLQKSIASTKSTKKQKALSFSSLGNVYYSMGDYNNAKLSYDSAAYLAKYAINDPDVEIAVKRAGVLDKVSYPARIIREQDSLLALSRMSENEQKDIIRRYIRSLEKAREDSIARAENGDIPATANAGDMGNSNTSWYFSNPTLMQQGLNDFKRKWGNRANTDNWRRGTKMGGGVASTETQAQQTEEELNGFDENGIPTELSLLASIPSSNEQKEAANKKIQSAYMDLGNAYINDVNDYERAKQTLDTFDQRFPNNDSKAEALYLRYQLALKHGDLALAQSLSETIKREYPNSKWASMVGPVDDGTSTNPLASNTAAAATYYDETYNMMMARNYAELLPRTREAQKQYPVYADRFKIMEAVALVGTGNYDLADSLMTKFIAAKPTDSLKRWANAVLKFSKNNRPVLTPPATNTTDSTNNLPVNILTNPNGASAVTKPGNPTAPSSPLPPAGTTPSNLPPVYAYDTKTPHYFLFYYYKAESKAMGVKAALNDFNTFNYSGQKLKSSMEMLQATQGLIMVKSFPSASAAKIYMNAVAKNKQIFREYQANEYQLMIISEDNYNKLKNDKDVKPYVDFYKKHYK